MTDTQSMPFAEILGLDPSDKLRPLEIERAWGMRYRELVALRAKGIPVATEISILNHARRAAFVEMRRRRAAALSSAHGATR